MRRKKDLNETVNIRIKIKQLCTGHCKTRDLLKTRAELIYFKSITGKPMNGYAVVYAEELEEI